jgi:hypothetical protein
LAVELQQPPKRAAVAMVRLQMEMEPLGLKTRAVVGAEQRGLEVRMEATAAPVS